MSSFFREMAFCTYDTLDYRQKIIKPFLIINFFSLLVINSIFFYIKNEYYLFESLLLLVCIVLSSYLIKKIRVNPILSFPAFLLVIYSFINLANPSRMNFFTQDTWLMIQVVALVYVNFLGSTRCNLVLGLVILLSPLFGAYFGHDPIAILNKQLVIYFLFPTTLYLSYVRTRLSIEQIDSVNRMNELALQNLRQEQKLIEEENLYELGKMTSMIAHEINNPLTVVNLTLGMLLKDQTLTSETKERLLKINKYAQRISQIVGLVKKKSFVTNQRENFNLNNLINDEVELYEIALTAKNIQLEVKLNSIVEVNANEREISQVIGNLISNATHALENSKKNGPKKITIELLKENEKSTLKIIDNADGIQQEHQESIFKENFTTKKKGSGLGIGLSLVKKIIESNKAKISFNSSPQGTEFIIQF